MKLEDWEIDLSTGTKILVYKKCSVIEDEVAEYLLNLIGEDLKENKEKKDE